MRDVFPRPNIWKAYAHWSFWVTVSFLVVYPACNWIASKQAATMAIYFDWELEIPFVPSFAIGYASLLLIFYIPPFFLDATGIRTLGLRMIGATALSGVMFLLLPARMGFARTVPSESSFLPLYEIMFLVDLPHNLVPSLHVIYSALILLTAASSTQNRLTRVMLLCWLIVVCFSTILIHQHHVVDVASGIAIAMATIHFKRVSEAAVTSIGSRL